MEQLHSAIMRELLGICVAMTLYKDGGWLAVQW